MEAWRVHKFGGSSVADAACMRRVADILEADPASRQAVVLSACRGVTDALLNLVDAAERRDPAWVEQLEAIRARHVDLARDPAERRGATITSTSLDADFTDLHGLLQTVQLIRQRVVARMRDIVAGLRGAVVVAPVRDAPGVSAGRSGARVEWVDARDIIAVEHGPLGPRVRWPESRAQCRTGSSRATGRSTLIVPGFVARDGRGLQTTLGRNGSDFSAAIFGALLDAGEITSGPTWMAC